MSTVLELWTERNLTAEARAGKLEPGFEIDDIVSNVAGVIDSGASPILTGESGVGKTAAVRELVRRTVAGTGAVRLRGRTVIQVSLARRASMLKNRYEMCATMQEFVEVMQKLGHKYAVFIRDMHLAYTYDLEPHLEALAGNCECLLIGEGPRVAMDALLEHEPSLRQYFAFVQVDEPSVTRTQRIATAWASGVSSRGRQRFSADAVEQAVGLTHRFIARGCLPRKAFDLLRLADAHGGGREVIDARTVIDRFCATHRIPRELIDPDERLDLATLRDSLMQRVVGQHEAVDAVVDMLALMKTGLCDASRPLGAFLFVGPTGVGKTHVARLVAERLFGDPGRVVRFNMADFAREHDAGLLFGNADGQRPAQVRGLMTARLMAHPIGVVLLDEFEKANPKVHDRFLQLIDEGAFVNGAGETISCRSMILIATSNAGAEVFRGRTFGFANGDFESRSRQALAALEKHFRFELLNRFDRIVPFAPLSRDTVRRIAARELAMLGERPGPKRHRITVKIDPRLVSWVTERGYDAEHGARMLRRAIDQDVAAALAALLVEERPEPGSTVRLTVENDRAVARVQRTHGTRGGVVTERAVAMRDLDRVAPAALARTPGFVPKADSAVNA